MSDIWTYQGPVSYGTPLDNPSIWIGESAAALGTIPASVVSVPLNNAFKNVIVQIPTESLIPVTLWELRNPKELIPRISKWIWKHGDDVLLWWSFVAKPLIRDIKAVLTAGLRVRKRLAHLMRINRQPRTFRFRDGNVWSPSEPLPSGSGGSDPDTLRRTAVRCLESSRYDIDIVINATVSIEGLEGPWAFWDSYATALGFNQPAMIAWEVIPFSFVLDWFVRIGDWIEANATISPFKGKAVIHSAWHTVRHVNMYGYYAPTTPDGDWERYASCVLTGYHRLDGVPQGTLLTSGLTPMQQALGAALLTSQGKRILKRRRR